MEGTDFVGDLPTVGYWISKVFLSNMQTLQRARFAAALQYGVEFFTFCNEDVNIDKQTINGLFWDKESRTYVNKTVKYPMIVDYRLNSQLDIKYPEVYQSLKNNSYIASKRGIGTKDRVQAKISQGSFAKYIIPTHKFDENTDIKELCEKYKTIILKPVGGANGDGIIKIAENEDKYNVHYLTEIKEVAHTKLMDYLQVMIEGGKHKKYIVQKFIKSQTVDNIAMDIRLNLVRGIEGKFHVSNLYTRYGGKGYVGSNMGRGERCAGLNIRKDLKYHFGEQRGKDFYKEIRIIARKFPDEFQKKVSFALSELAIDIGIDKDEMKLYFFEINGQPGAVLKPYEIAEHNIGFYRYLFEKGIVG